MQEIQGALDELLQHEAVRHALVLGRDGLLIQQVGTDRLDADAVSAMVPAIFSHCDGLGDAADLGNAATVVVELGQGVAVLAGLGEDLLLALLLEPDVGFAPLLGELRRRRAELAALV